MREPGRADEGSARPSAPPAIVLVHGACSDSGCWAPTVAAIAARAPDVHVVAVDLPGRGQSPVPLAGVTVSACVDEVVRQIEDAGGGDVVLVGHSLAGVILPGVATRLGSDRVRRLVFLTCAVPPEGGSVVDVLRGPLRAIAAVAARRRSPTRLPTFVALAAFANGMDRAQRVVVAGSLCPEAGWLIGEAVSRRGFDRTIPRTWVLTLRDRGLSLAQQRRSIDNLGGVDECVELDAPHDAMVSHPDDLAAILLERVRGDAQKAVTK
jgi:pimeloyl-ACP methyl ester carboxylesterase